MNASRSSTLPLLLLVLALTAGCIREPAPPPPPAPPTPGIYYEEDLQPAPTIRLEIIGLQDVQDETTKLVTVTGTLINRGDKPTSEVMVKVTALDEHGDSLVTVPAISGTDHIAARGGTAKFTAQFPANAAIRSYNVEAVAR